MNFPAWSRIVVPSALLLMLPAAHADILIDNLSQPTSATSILPSDNWAAQSFVTAGDPVRLLSVELPIGLAVSGRSIFAELHADAGPQQVGATLASFVLPVVSTDALQIELLPALPSQKLAPDTTYWVVLGVVGGGSFGWSYALGNASGGPGTLANYAYSTDAGATWLSYGNADPYQMRVNVRVGARARHGGAADGRPARNGNAVSTQEFACRDGFVTSVTVPRLTSQS